MLMQQVRAYTVYRITLHPILHRNKTLPLLVSFVFASFFFFCCSLLLLHFTHSIQIYALVKMSVQCVRTFTRSKHLDLGDSKGWCIAIIYFLCWNYLLYRIEIRIIDFVAFLQLFPHQACNNYWFASFCLVFVGTFRIIFLLLLK